MTLIAPQKTFFLASLGGKRVLGFLFTEDFHWPPLVAALGQGCHPFRVTRTRGKKGKENVGSLAVTETISAFRTRKGYCE